MTTFTSAYRRPRGAGRLEGRWPRAFAYGALALLIGLGITGCGGSGYSVAPVSGTVSVDGKPTAGIALTYQPLTSDKNKNPGPGSAGVTDANGRYTLKVVVAGQNKAGAVVGKHRVTLVTAPAPRDEADDTAHPPPKELIPAKELGKAREFEVPAGGTDKADFNLSSK